MSEKYQHAEANVYNGLTIGGIDLNDCSISILADGNQELLWNYFVDAYPNLSKGERETIRQAAIQEASSYQYLGDFLGDVTEQFDLIAAFGLVTLDRFASAHFSGKAGLELVYLWDQMCECADYIRHRDGYFAGLSSQAFAGIARSRQARNAAEARYRIDPKQTAKAHVKECWKAWQKLPTKYKSAAAFARDMLDKQSILTSQKKIEDWVREWKNE